MEESETRTITPSGIAFTVASRPQARFAASQTVSNLAAGTPFQPISLPATGFVRRISLHFTFTYTTSGSAAVVAGDAPWNLVSAVTLTDATGQPIFQPLTGYQLYLRNKYLSHGTYGANRPLYTGNPHLGPEFAYSASGTAGTATFRLDLPLEIDSNTGYGSIPNLDSNAALQLKIDVAATSVAFTGGTASAATASVRVTQHYWGLPPAELGGRPVNIEPVGLGDYVETRMETQVVTASSENLVNVSNRGGALLGMIAVSRAAGVRTAVTAGSAVGLILDNNPVTEGVTVEEHYADTRRAMGSIGADLTTSYAPLSAGLLAGLDRGVVAWNFDAQSGGRDSWLVTKAGSQLQLRLTPGASATQLEIITVLGQIRRSDVFYGRSAIA